MSVRVLIADDHTVLRAGLSALLASQPDLEVVGEARDGDEALVVAQSSLPDLALVDIAMPGKNGLEVTRAMKEVCPHTRILILTASEEGGILTEALQAGAAGYVVKRAVESELLSAIRAVMRGDMYVHPSMTRALLEPAKAAAPKTLAGGIEPLSRREQEVAGLLAQGLTNAQVGEKLGLSRRTIESYRANIMAKLDAHTRADIVRYATEHGLLETPTSPPARSSRPGI